MPRAKRPAKPVLRNFSERFFPARPTMLLQRARKLMPDQFKAPKIGLPVASNRAYVNWLKRESMLQNANKQAKEYSGTAKLWQNPYAKPRPRSAVKQASVWFTAYPISTITKSGTSIISTFGDPALWKAFQDIGIKALHTGPMKRAGGIVGWNSTASIDGHFDRISTKLDQTFGTEAQFKQMREIATAYGGIIIDDIVPGHTGKGPDFRLAEMSYGDYPGIYHMIEIAEADWHLLPAVPKGKDSVNISPEIEDQLKQKGYIIGKLQRVIFYEKNVKETNWSATKVTRGVDGVRRRWVYLHYFKDGQPSINWLDPSFAGMKLVIGDALHSIGQMGSKGLRLDANGFLGLEKNTDDTPAWSEGHPLSVAANHLIASMVRKIGGFTFQELNLSIDDIKAMSIDGADLSYDFITRPAYHHALAQGDASFLKLCLREALDLGVDSASLVHALQNHDDLTFELVHFWTLHRDDEFEFRNSIYKGHQIRDIIREELTSAIVKPETPYNMLFTENGIACTTASLIAAILDYRSYLQIDDEAIKKIADMHLLLAMYNAFQPGVFALSGWDLSGSLALSPQQIEDLLADGDTRWISRGAYDLMNVSPSSQKSISGMPKAVNLYGSLPEQMSNPDSFARRLQTMLAVREKYGIATGRQIDVPDTSVSSVLVMVHLLSGGEQLQVTVLNFADKPQSVKFSSHHFKEGAQVIDMFTEQAIGVVQAKRKISLDIEAYGGMSLLVDSLDTTK